MRPAQAALCVAAVVLSLAALAVSAAWAHHVLCVLAVALVAAAVVALGA